MLLQLLGGGASEGVSPNAGAREAPQSPSFLLLGQWLCEMMRSKTRSIVNQAMVLGQKCALACFWILQADTCARRARESFYVRDFSETFHILVNLNGLNLQNKGTLLSWASETL